MSEEDIKSDRYNKFRKLGEFREFLVEGGNWQAADERRSSASGVTTKTGRWAEVRSPLFASTQRFVALPCLMVAPNNAHNVPP